MRPEFVDNLELKLIDALNGHLDWLEATYKSPVAMSIATGYFNAEGFNMIADRLERLSGVRLLLGAEPVPPPAQPSRKPGDPTGAQFEAKLVSEGLEKTAAGLLRDRDHLEFDPASDKAVTRLLDFLKSGLIEVRRYEKAFLHGKAYLFGTDLFGAPEGVLAGSSNFTAAGLTRNLELNLGRYDPTPAGKVKDWFDRLWDDAVPYDLAAIYAARYAEYSPYLIYLRVLWERYHGEVEEEAVPGSRIKLTTFQNDGIFRAKRILDQYNGVLIADAVGLGKTFIGGELIREVVETRRQRALLIAPAALRDGTWARFEDRHQLYLEKISFEQLARDQQLGGDSPNIPRPLKEYELIVIDEAQAFRNPDTVRGKALTRLLQDDPPKKLVLMSATPVNNSIWDLFYLLGYFIKHDAGFADLGIRSLKDKFRQVAEQDADDLRPDLLFDVLDATTVRRTRSFVQKYYPNDRVTGPGGVEMLIRFPKPHIERISYSLDAVLPGFFTEFAEALMPEEGDPLLSMARYLPSSFRTQDGGDASEAALVGLVRSGLLKRFESSVYAFSRTLERLVAAHDVFLDGLDRGVVLTAEEIEEWQQVDSDEAIEELLQVGGSESTSGYRVKELKAKVAFDRELLAKFHQKSSKVNRPQDPKLKALVSEGLKPILRRARREAAHEGEFQQKRKVLIFSYYADTVDWIFEYLQERFDNDPSLKPYRGRLVAVKGDESSAGMDREEAVFRFAPESSEAPPGMTDDFDVMVTTDVLAEGMNLQQCRHIINYDLPWNPMRLVQRHGRIDRIGSPHEDVYMGCFFPDANLEVLLELETRIRRKVAQAAATVGIEHEVIPGAATSDQVFAETREEIEKLRQENPELFETGGEAKGAQSGEAYRQELRKGLERFGKQISDLPWGAGSGIYGERDGHFFCARVGDRVYLRFVPLDGQPILKESLTCLRLISCTEQTARVLNESMREGAYGAWRQARNDIFEEWMFATDPANLQPRVRPLLRRAAELVRKFPPTGMEQEKIDDIASALEAPWGSRTEHQIREAMGDTANAAAAGRIVEAVKRLGLEPYQAPEPLPPIAVEDVALVCWMAVESAPIP
jgi:hypothetical protein